MKPNAAVLSSRVLLSRVVSDYVWNASCLDGWKVHIPSTTLAHQAALLTSG